MAVFAALGKTLGVDAVPIIFSFLDDSSVVTNWSSSAGDVANLDDFSYINFADDGCWSYSPYNRYLSIALLNMDGLRTIDGID